MKYMGMNRISVENFLASFFFTPYGIGVQFNDHIRDTGIFGSPRDVPPVYPITDNDQVIVQLMGIIIGFGTDILMPGKKWVILYELPIAKGVIAMVRMDIERKYW